MVLFFLLFYLTPPPIIIILTTLSTLFFCVYTIENVDNKFWLVTKNLIFSALFFFRLAPWRRQAVLVSPGKIRVSDVSSEVIEELDFSGGRVVEMSLGFGHLVVATHNQVCARWYHMPVAARGRVCWGGGGGGERNCGWRRVGSWRIVRCAWSLGR